MTSPDSAETFDTNDFDDVDEDVTSVTSASNNSYCPVDFNALPESGAADLECERPTVDLRPERDVSLNVEMLPLVREHLPAHRP